MSDALQQKAVGAGCVFAVFSIFLIVSSVIYTIDNFESLAFFMFERGNFRMEKAVPFSKPYFNFWLFKFPHSKVKKLQKGFQNHLYYSLPNHTHI